MCADYLQMNEMVMNAVVDYLSKKKKCFFLLKKMNLNVVMKCAHAHSWCYKKFYQMTFLCSILLDSNSTLRKRALSILRNFT